jgi:hypothetical protein
MDEERLVWDYNWPFANSTRKSLRDIRYDCEMRHMEWPRLLCPCCLKLLSLRSLRRHEANHRQEEPEHSQSEENGSDSDSPDGIAVTSDDERDIVPANAAGGSVDQVLEKFGVRFRECIARSGSQKNGDEVLKLMHGTIFEYLPPEVRNKIPRTARGLKGLVSDLHDPTYFYRDYCPKDHHMFDADDVDDVFCPICQEDTRYSRNGRPKRRAIYFRLDDYLRRVLTLPGVLEYQLAWNGWSCAIDVSLTSIILGIVQDFFPNCW